MTVALGVLVGNSQILAADTQMSTDTEKVGQGKISFSIVTPTSERPRGLIAITGAGDVFNLQALQADLTDLFSETADESLEEFGDKARRMLKAFYRDHVAITPDTSQRPEVELIIAARRGVFSQTWVTKRNRLSVAKSPVAVGIGASYAQSLLDTLAFSQSAETAMLAAAYTVFLVKSRNLWVGMDTEVVCLDDGLGFPPKGFSASACRKLEDLFRQCIAVETRTVHRMFGSQYDFCGAEHLAREVEFLRERFVEIFQPRSDSTSERSQT